MKYFIDTEFLERPFTIELISLGIVCEDGRELYLENSDVDLSKGDAWIQANVVPHLTGKGIPHREFKDKVLEFVVDDPEWWGYFSDYDWVVFCWIFGRMIDLPKHFPKYCRDLKQTMDYHNIKKSQLPQQEGNLHNALADARWVCDAYFALNRLTSRK